MNAVKFAAYEISELLDMLEKENHAVAVHSKFFSCLLGTFYIGLGLFCWEESVRAWPLVWQAGGFLLALAAWPIVLGIFGKLNRLLGHWPHCPECHSALENFNPALRFCPECRQVIVSDRRALLPGYIPPESDALKPRKSKQKNGSIGLFAGQIIILFVIAIPCLLAKITACTDDSVTP